MTDQIRHRGPHLGLLEYGHNLFNTEALPFHSILLPPIKGRIMPETLRQFGSKIRGPTRTATREVTVMPRKRYTPEEVIQHLRTVELDTGKGLAVLDACRKLGMTEPTYDRWKKEYGGLRVDQAKRLNAWEQENLRLKRIMANQALDLSILQEVASGNF